MTEKSEESAGKPVKYETPKVVAVSLRPDEAVLGHCKTISSMGPVSASCRTVACKVLGS
jgi:hypothetical protein